MGIPLKGTIGVLLTAVMAGLLSKEEAVADLTEMVQHGIRVSFRLQDWLKEELEKSNLK